MPRRRERSRQRRGLRPPAGNPAPRDSEAEEGEQLEQRLGSARSAGRPRAGRPAPGCAGHDPGGRHRHRHGPAGRDPGRRRRHGRRWHRAGAAAGFRGARARAHGWRPRAATPWLQFVTTTSTTNSENWRRRLRPAAPLVVLGCAVAWLLVALVRVRSPGIRRPGRGPAAPRAARRGVVCAPRQCQAAAGRRRRVNLVARTRPAAADPIPAIGVRARLVPLRTRAGRDDADAADLQRPAGTSRGREPGERGPAVIAGHVDSTAGPRSSTGCASSAAGT